MKKVHAIAQAAILSAAIYSVAMLARRFDATTALVTFFSMIGFMAGVWLSLSSWRSFSARWSRSETDRKWLWLYSLLCVLCVAIVGVPFGILVVAYLTQNTIDSVIGVGAMMGGILFGQVAAIGVACYWLCAAIHRSARKPRMPLL